LCSDRRDMARGYWEAELLDGGWWSGGAAGHCEAELLIGGVGRGAGPAKRSFSVGGWCWPREARPPSAVVAAGEGDRQWGHRTVQHRADRAEQFGFTDGEHAVVGDDGDDRFDEDLGVAAGQAV